MSSLPIIITGTGRSGTTFLAHTFAKAGFDIGGIPTHLIGQGTRPSGGGLEWTQFRLLNKDIFQRLQSGEDAVTIANDIRPHIPTTFPAVIKHPLYIFTFHVWEMAGYVPEHIFLCVRNPDATQDSFRKVFQKTAKVHRHLCAAYALQAHALESDIPLTPVSYPRIGTDNEYANTTLSPFIEHASLITRSIWDASLHSCTVETQHVLQDVLRISL